MDDTPEIYPVVIAPHCDGDDGDDDRDGFDLFDTSDVISTLITNPQTGVSQDPSKLIIQFTYVDESGNTVTIDLTNSTFNSITNPGDYINLTAVGILLLKISNTNYRAFDNCCPHNGSKNAWSYSNEKFQCATHGNSFSIDGNDAKECNSGSTTGGLKKYSASLSGDTLTITKS